MKTHTSNTPAVNEPADVETTAPAPRKPSIGDRVIVPMDPETNNGATTAPATITRVWSDTCVNVRVLGDGDGAPEWRTSLTLVESAEAAEDKHHVCWWPAQS